MDEIDEIGILKNQGIFISGAAKKANPKWEQMF